MDPIKCTVDGFPQTVNSSPLKKALEQRIQRTANNVTDTATVIKDIVDNFLLEKDDMGIPNVESSTVVVHNTSCLKIKLTAISTNEVNLCNLVKLYNLENIGMEYEYIPKLGNLTLYLYPLEYRVPNQGNVNYNRIN